MEQDFITNVGLWQHIIPQIMARLTLKGNLVRAAGRPDVYLDGDTFADPNDEMGIRRPTGDGRRGGDFEMYAWLETTFIG